MTELCRVIFEDVAYIVGHGNHLTIATSPVLHFRIAFAESNINLAFGTCLYALTLTAIFLPAG